MSIFECCLILNFKCLNFTLDLTLTRMSTIFKINYSWRQVFDPFEFWLMTLEFELLRHLHKHDFRFSSTHSSISLKTSASFERRLCGMYDGNKMSKWTNKSPFSRLLYGFGRPSDEMHLMLLQLKLVSIKFDFLRNEKLSYSMTSVMRISSLRSSMVLMMSLNPVKASLRLTL